MRYLVEMVSRTRFYIESDTEDEALDWAAIHTTFDVDSDTNIMNSSTDYEENILSIRDETGEDCIKLN